VAVCLALGAVSLGAQRGTSGRGASRTQQPKPDSTQGRGAAAQAYALDFQNQDLQVVLSALAEAGNLNVTMTNIPSQRVTVRMAKGAPKDTLVTMIRSLAEANGVKFSTAGSLIRLDGDPNSSPAAQQAAVTAAQNAALQQQAAQQQLRLFTYRLKHASAVTVAPVLMNLLGAGGTTIGNTTFLPNGGIQINNPGGAGGAGAGRGGNAGGAVAAPGRGGGAAQQNFTFTAPNAGGGNNNNAAALGALGALGAGRGGAAQQALVQGLLGGLAGAQGGGQGAPGTLSNSAAQIRIVAEESTNSLLIRATQPDFQLLQGIVQAIDLRPLQALIEVTIAEVQRSNDLNVGIGGTATRKGATAAASRYTVGLLPGNASARDFIFQLTGGNGSISYNAALNALQTRGDVKVLSLPVIIAQNNKEAKLNVGEQRPFVQVNQSVTTGTVPTTVQTVQYISVGTTLTITPTINPDGYVNMAVDQTNNSATNEVEFNAPVISQREATTQIFLKDGQTTVIGGLAGNSTTKTTSGIPILSRIPLIGGLLFGNSQSNTTTNELFLFLTPHIISSDEDIERFRNSLQSNTELLKDMPLGARIVPGDSMKIDSTKKSPADSTKRPDAVKRPDELPISRRWDR
jgi:type II secretory pathway component GspD/PulD (secretin)